MAMTNITLPSSPSNSNSNSNTFSVSLSHDSTSTDTSNTTSGISSSGEEVVMNGNNEIVGHGQLGLNQRVNELRKSPTRGVWLPGHTHYPSNFSVAATKSHHSADEIMRESRSVRAQLLQQTSSSISSSSLGTNNNNINNVNDNNEVVVDSTTQTNTNDYGNGDGRRKATRETKGLMS